MAASESVRPVTITFTAGYVLTSADVKRSASLLGRLLLSSTTSPCAASDRASSNAVAQPSTTTSASFFSTEAVTLPINRTSSTMTTRITPLAFDGMEKLYTRKQAGATHIFNLACSTNAYLTMRECTTVKITDCLMFFAMRAMYPELDFARASRHSCRQALNP